MVTVNGKQMNRDEFREWVQLNRLNIEQKKKAAAKRAAKKKKVGRA